MGNWRQRGFVWWRREDGATGLSDGVEGAGAAGRSCPVVQRRESSTLGIFGGAEELGRGCRCSVPARRSLEETTNGQIGVRG